MTVDEDAAAAEALRQGIIGLKLREIVEIAAACGDPVATLLNAVDVLDAARIDRG